MSGHNIVSTFKKAGDGIKKAAVTVADGTKKAAGAVAHETVKDANKVASGTKSIVNKIGSGTQDALRNTGNWFVNAEHTVARTSLKTIGQVTAWTNKEGQIVSTEVVKDAKITAKGFGAAICETAKHGDAIDMVWKDVAHPIVREVMTAAGPETEAFIPALEIANLAASEGFKAAGGWPALEKSGCRLAQIRTLIILL